MTDNTSYKHISMSSRLTKLVTGIMIPMVLLVAGLILILVWYNMQYQSVLSNVTSASAFNQDFKNDIDLKMFYYVSESAYAEGIPREEVDSARELAENLLQNTTEKNSIEAIESVRDLCVTLKQRMNDIENTESYDERMTELDGNIYILTDLIQTYMYDYLYYESVHLSTIQSAMSIQLRILVITLIVILVVLLVGLIIYTGLMTRLITEPITKLTGRMKDVSEGDLEPREPVQASELEIQTLSDGLETMVGQINTLVRENQEAERWKRHAELELLQAQINPHFLYNTLDTIIWLIEADEKKKSIDMASDLSDFFRSSLSRGRDVITLAEEQKHVLAYLHIQKTRYMDRMDYDIRIPEELGCYRLPKLTLQPLVENSIYHGIKMQREKGHISVQAKDMGDTIEILVADDGAGMSAERLEELQSAMNEGEKVGFGLRTVHERLRLLFGEPYGLKVESEQGVGTSVTVTIPKQKIKDTEEQNENEAYV